MSGNERTDLPEELAGEILSRLPVKSLIRFRFSCKSWFAKIRDPDFVIKHLLFHHHNKNKGDPNTLQVLLTVSEDRHSERSYYTLFSMLSLQALQVKEQVDMSFSSVPTILGPCNGVLFCFSTNENAWVWNPTTKEVRRQPNWLQGSLGRPFGFFHDPITSQYAVLRYLDHRSNALYMHRYEFCPSGINSWKKFHIPVPYARRPANGVSLNGVYHWFYHNDDPDNSFGIISFDVSQETFRSIPMPGELYTVIAPEYLLYDSLQLAVFDGCLALCLDVFIRRSSCLCGHFYHIWVMKEYGTKESWAKLSVIGPVCRLDKLLGFWKNGALFSTQSNLIWHRLDTKEVKEFDIRCPRSGLKNRICIESAVILSDESLVSVNGRQEAQHKITRRMAM